MAAGFDIPDQRERSAALDPEKSFIVPSRILENIISETKDFIILALK